MKNKKPKLKSDINAPPSRTDLEWSDDSTNILVEAWADQYVEDGKLPNDKWPSIVTAFNDKVTAMGLNESARTQSQCKHQMDTLMMNYKSERARVLASNGPVSSSHSPLYHFFHDILGDFTPTTQEELQDDGFRELVGAIKSFGDSYLKIKEEKLKQINELEKQRIESFESLELEKIKLFTDTQVQIAKMMLGKDIIPSEEPKNTPAPQNSDEV